MVQNLFIQLVRRQHQTAKCYSKTQNPKQGFVSLPECVLVLVGVVWSNLMGVIRYLRTAFVGVTR